MAPSPPLRIKKRIRIGHGNCDLMVIFGDDTDMRRRQSLNFIELKGEPGFAMR
jgi:hypothetical protein